MRQRGCHAAWEKRSSRQRAGIANGHKRRQNGHQPCWEDLAAAVGALPHHARQHEGGACGGAGGSERGSALSAERRKAQASMRQAGPCTA